MLSSAALAYRVNESQILCFFCNHLPDQPEPPGTAAGARGVALSLCPPCFRSGNILFPEQKHSLHEAETTWENRC